MGDIKKLTNKYDTPSHPWRKERIDAERALRKQYGLKNSRELWKVTSKLKNFKDQVKSFATMAPSQASVERRQLLERLERYGLAPVDGNLETVLGYTPNALLDRRLQTLLVKKQLAHTMRQARQFITHRHVLVGEQCVTAPGYLVPLSEEAHITFKVNSSLFSEEHPERLSAEETARRRADEKETRKKAEEPQEEVIEISEEDNVE